MAILTKVSWPGSWEERWSTATVSGYITELWVLVLLLPLSVPTIVQIMNREQPLNSNSFSLGILLGTLWEEETHDVGKGELPKRLAQKQ